MTPPHNLTIRQRRRRGADTAARRDRVHYEESARRALFDRPDTQQPAVAPDSARPARWGPARVQVAARHVQVGASRVSATLVVTGYPREVYPGWLEPLTSYPGRVDVSVHITRIDAATATARLRRQLARLESGRRSAADHGRLRDPYADAATEDAYALADRVARGEGHLFTVALTITVHAEDPDELTERVQEISAVAASMLLEARPTTFRALPGWLTGLPLGIDRLAQTRTFDTDALAAAFPLASADLPAPPGGQIRGAAPAGVLYGRNLATPSLVFWDRFGCDNYNAVVLARSGAGKSYLVKLELLRSLYRGVDAHVIDPEDEYTRLADAVGGLVVRPGTLGVRLNPLDLALTSRGDGTLTAPRDALTRRSLFLHTFLAVLLDTTLSPTDHAVLDAAITTTYARAGITADDPTTWTRPAPLLSDLRTTLTHYATEQATPAQPAAQPGGNAAATPPDAEPDGQPDARPDATSVEAARRLAASLVPFTGGAFREMFTGPTTTRPQSHLVVWALRDLPDQLRPVATLLALDAIWGQVTNPADPWPRMVVVDEAWLLMQQPEGAKFLLRLAKGGRKHWAGLTIATQDVADILSTDLGKAVVANAATQILLRQAPQALDTVTATFGLSTGERAFLAAAERGDALLSAGRHRVAFRALAADTEHALITTNPDERAHRTTSTHTNAEADPGDVGNTGHLVLLDPRHHPATGPDTDHDDLEIGDGDGDGDGDDRQREGADGVDDAGAGQYDDPSVADDDWVDWDGLDDNGVDTRADHEDVWDDDVIDYADADPAWDDDTWDDDADLDGADADDGHGEIDTPRSRPSR